MQKIQDEMRGNGYETAYSVVDVAEIDQLQFAVDQCIKTFGRIDTFINNAGVSIYAKILETSLDEAKRLFDTNFWGVVNGSKVAIPYLKLSRGTLINVGSVLSTVALPVQGFYSSSKFAVKGFTDALRRELLADKIPVQVTLVKPGAIDTPYVEHARSHIGKPVHKAPVYSADVAARTILRCAEVPTREIGVGASAFTFPMLESLFPKFQDLFLAKNFMEDDQSSSRSSFEQKGALTSPPLHEGHEAGDYSGHVMKSSLATSLAERKGLVKLSVALAGLGWIVLKKRQAWHERQRESDHYRSGWNPS